MWRASARALCVGLLSAGRDQQRALVSDRVGKLTGIERDGAALGCAGQCLCPIGISALSVGEADPVSCCLSGV